MNSSPRILFVDDDDGIRQFVSMALEDEGYEVVTAVDGMAALSLLQQQPPHLILTDMRMPGMDGWAFVRNYRQTAKPHVPVIVVTAARDAAVSASEVNADGYLSKPFHLDDLLALVQSYTPHL